MKTKNEKLYNEQLKKHRKNLVKIAKETYPWDYGWSFSFLLEHLKMMRDYYSIPENVAQEKDNCKLCYEIADKMIKEYNAYECLPEDERKEIAKQLNVDYEKIEDNTEFKTYEAQDELFGKVTCCKVVHKYYSSEINNKYYNLIDKEEEQHYINFIELLKTEFRKLWD